MTDTNRNDEPIIGRDERETAGGQGQSGQGQAEQNQADVEDAEFEEDDASGLDDVEFDSDMEDGSSGTRGG